MGPGIPRGHTNELEKMLCVICHVLSVGELPGVLSQDLGSDLKDEYSFQARKERKGIPSGENGMCKGPAAGASRKEGQGGQGTDCDWSGERWAVAGPHRALQHTGEFCFILKPTGSY